MVDIIVSVVVCGLTLVFVIAFLVWLLVQDRNKFDRRERDLLNRIMARTFQEYVSGSAKLEEEIGKIPQSASIESIIDQLDADHEAAIKV